MHTHESIKKRVLVSVLFFWFLNHSPYPSEKQWRCPGEASWPPVRRPGGWTAGSRRSQGWTSQRPPAHRYRCSGSWTTTAAGRVGIRVIQQKTTHIKDAWDATSVSVPVRFWLRNWTRFWSDWNLSPPSSWVFLRRCSKTERSRMTTFMVCLQQ